MGHDDWFNGFHRRSYCRSVDASATASGFFISSGPVRMDIILMMSWRLVDGLHGRSCDQCTQFSSASCQVIMTGQWIAWIHRSSCRHRQLARISLFIVRCGDSFAESGAGWVNGFHRTLEDTQFCLEAKDLL